MSLIKILFLTFFVLTSCSHHKNKPNRAPLSTGDKKSNSNNDLQKELIKKLDLKLGLYLPEEDSPEACYEGDLELLNVDDTVSILISNRLLIGSLKINKNTFSFKEYNCLNKYEIEVLDKRIVSRHEKKCANSKTISLKTINFNKDEINYSVNTKENGKPIFVINCLLRKN